MPNVMHMAGLRRGASQRVFIATPTYGAPCPLYTFSLFQSHVALMAAGIEADLCILTGNCHVDDARNDLVRRFLATDCTDFLFVDADLGWNAAEMIRLLSHDRDVVAGLYPYKSDDEGYPVQIASPVIALDDDGLVLVERVPTGFLRIRRPVLERMYEAEAKAGRTFYGHGDRDETPKPLPMALIFERMLVNGERLSGDYGFCHKWRQIGGEIYIDPTLTFAHVGEKQWTGNVAGYWLRVNDESDQVIAAAVERLCTEELHLLDLSDFERLANAFGNQPWAAGPELLKQMFDAALANDGPILECGAGVSTLVLAAAVKRRFNPLYVLEQDETWAARMSDILARCGLNDVMIAHAPIEKHEFGRWYGDIPEFPVERFGLVVIDGPVRSDPGIRARIVDAIPEMVRGAAFIMDDIEDDDGESVAARISELTGRILTVTYNKNARAFATMPAGGY